MCGHPQRVMKREVDRNSCVDQRADAADKPSHEPGVEEHRTHRPPHLRAVDQQRTSENRYHGGWKRRKVRCHLPEILESARLDEVHVEMMEVRRGHKKQRSPPCD